MPSDRSQLAYLDAMGVDLWVRRDAPEDAPEQPEVEEQLQEAPKQETAAAESSEDVTDVAAPVAAAPTPVSAPAPDDAATDNAAPGVSDVTDPVDVPAKSDGSVETQSEPEAQEDQAELIAKADLESLQSLVSSCERCPLSRTRNETVFGSGNPNADWLFVGEAPGREEDREGEAFVGKAGQLLNAMLHALSLTRDDVFIANVLKCRPPDNRDPMGEEVVRCEPYLHRQVDLVEPKVIVSMGRFAAQALLRSNENISRMRGGDYSYRETGIPLVVTYHPAYLLRTPDQKGKVWADLLKAKRIIDGG